ncbi:MAG: 3-phosphoshikimate 1-carboxyvinyltransferase [Anaerolineaceae bacterium]|nr:MAG: 3-phosphoshikimate 1-carboxyvinyltransferase [Anaerolineaceae bacterium]
MQTLTTRPGGALRGETDVPGDKSISHRAVMFGGLLARGVSHVRGWLRAGDTVATLSAVKGLGIQIDEADDTLVIHGDTPHAPTQTLDLVNAGTGIRLLAGILCGQPFPAVLTGSEQLCRRPMRRIIEPLRLMGAGITGRDECAPLTIQPAALKGIDYRLPVASAQVKSAILLAALFAKDETRITQPAPARDHTEIMLKAMGADIRMEGDTVILTPSATPLSPLDMTVPGDFSSAAFPLVAACIVPDSDITLRHINLNTTRTGLLDVLVRMGADITVIPTGKEAGEPVGDLHVRGGTLKGVEVGGEMVVRMIDEFPVLMIAATQAEGRTVVRDAAELRVKETDRIAVMARELAALGVTVEETPDGFIIEGGQAINGGHVHAHDDHRVAMSLAVAGLVAASAVHIDDAQCAGDSFPDFAGTMRKLGADMA